MSKPYFTILKEMTGSITDRYLGSPEKTVLDKFAEQISNALQPSIKEVGARIGEYMAAWGLKPSPGLYALDGTSGSLANIPIIDMISGAAIPNGTFSISWEQVPGYQYQFRADYLSCKVSLSFDIDVEANAPTSQTSTTGIF